MTAQVLYAPHPPQFTLTLTFDQLAQRDARFGALPALRRRPSFPLIVQDSADLQQAHLRLHLGRRSVQGTPGALDEDGRGHSFLSSFSPSGGWSEPALEHALGLDVAAPRTRLMSSAAWFGEVQTWPQGAVYLFAAGPGEKAPTLARRLNLASFTDRLELEFLAQTNFTGCRVLRAHKLESGGQLLLLCAQLG